MTPTTAAADQDATHPNRPSWLVLLAVLLVGLGLGAVVTAVAVTRGGGQTSGSSTAQLSQIQASCDDWMTSTVTGTTSDDQWCTDMFAWMSDQSGGSMMGTMMWQGPDRMSRSCRAWVSQDRAGTSAASRQQCDQMVDWMSKHMSTHDGRWMMQGG